MKQQAPPSQLQAALLFSSSHHTSLAQPGDPQPSLGGAAVVFVGVGAAVVGAAVGAAVGGAGGVPPLLRKKPYYSRLHLKNDQFR